MIRLTAHFEKTYASGATVRLAHEQPAEGFSVTALYGPSGCGKTTALRCLAGLERPESGAIRWGGQTWFDSSRRIFLPPQRRGVGLMFQDYALFPHLSVEKNIAYGLSGTGKPERRRRVAHLLELMRLEGMGGRLPRHLSGGEQQRVALARVLAPRPRLVLLDEPLSALDGPTRTALRRELRRLLEQFNTPVVLVTHDHTEALALADHVLVMGRGGVLQSGPIDEVFSRPAGPEVARMVGIEVIVPGRVLRVAEGMATVEVGRAHVVAPAEGAIEGHVNVYVCIRPEDVVLQRGPVPPSSVRNHLGGRIVSVRPDGPLVRVQVDCGFELLATITRTASDELGLQEGQAIIASIKAAAIHLLPRRAPGPLSPWQGSGNGV